MNSYQFFKETKLGKTVLCVLGSFLGLGVIAQVLLAFEAPSENVGGGQLARGSEVDSKKIAACLADTKKCIKLNEAELLLAKEKMNERAQVNQLLSNTLQANHQSAMGIIENMRPANDYYYQYEPR